MTPSAFPASRLIRELPEQAATPIRRIMSRWRETGRLRAVQSVAVPVTTWQSQTFDVPKSRANNAATASGRWPEKYPTGTNVPFARRRGITATKSAPTVRVSATYSF